MTMKKAELSEDETRPPDKDAPPLFPKDEIVGALRKVGISETILGPPSNRFIIRTRLTANNREWCYHCWALRNGREIADDRRLAKTAVRKRREDAAAKTKAVWDGFIVDAARCHMEKANIIDRRLEKRKNGGRGHKHSFLLLFYAIFILTALGLAAHYLFFQRSSALFRPPIRAHGESQPTDVTADASADPHIPVVWETSPRLPNDRISIPMTPPEQSPARERVALPSIKIQDQMPQESTPPSENLSENQTPQPAPSPEELKKKISTILKDNHNQ